MKTFTLKHFSRTKKSASGLAERFVALFFLAIVLNSLPGAAQGNNYPSLTFHSPVLISGVGTENQVNAVYLFSNVCDGVDATITIMDIYHGATLNNIDDTTGVGYYDAFQPYVLAPANDSSYIDWKIDFKVAGTTRDTSLPKIAVTAIDVDGNGADLKEFIVASTPGTFGLDPDTYLQYTFDGVRSTAISTVANFPSIDTNQRKAMFQMNFKNVSSILYRNGAVSTGGGDMIRQTCIYFKSFFADELLLPVKLLSFNAVQSHETVVLNWSSTNETNLKYYTVQKSNDGSNWKNISNVTVGKKDVNDYSLTDLEKNQTTVYYRLNQISTSGLSTYSRILKITSKENRVRNIRHNTLVNDQINLQINVDQNDEYILNIFSIAGKNISETKNKIYSGTNNFSIFLSARLEPGMYILTIKNKLGQLVYGSKLVKN